MAELSYQQAKCLILRLSGATQAGAARMIGVHRSTIRNWEKLPAYRKKKELLEAHDKYLSEIMQARNEGVLQAQLLSIARLAGIVNGADIDLAIQAAEKLLKVDLPDIGGQQVASNEEHYQKLLLIQSLSYQGGTNGRDEPAE